MSTTPISLHNIVELSLALRNYDHATTLICQRSTYPHCTQKRITDHANMYLHTKCHKTILSYSSIKLDDTVAGTTIQMSCSSNMQYSKLLSETALSPQKLVTVQTLKIPCVILSFGFLLLNFRVTTNKRYFLLRNL